MIAVASLLSRGEDNPTARGITIGDTQKKRLPKWTHVDRAALLAGESQRSGSD
ncbi:hypothetical protein [Tengunoibacter tsumagoiensis]|uniref:hypothetical protein n=1 Tax=Tengunoibacter tsumagoiensis TaxID=2014871 RepID=UPI001386DAE0|nr:hypothetical protein [Tengunoibacter tsumagoiensis]